MKKILKIMLFIIASAVAYISTTEFYTPYENQKTNKEVVKFQEKDYVKKYCNGYIEFVLPDKTRVDCLTDEYAIEYDYAKKWAESIGQALYYAKKTGKKPAVALILTKPSDVKYVNRVKEAAENITIFEIPSVDYKE